MMRKKTEITIRVLISVNSGIWTAQAVDYDIAASAETLPDLEYEFTKTVMGCVAMSKDMGVEPFSTMLAAPEAILQAYDERSRDLEFRKLNVGSLDSDAPMLDFAPKILGAPMSSSNIQFASA